MDWIIAALDWSTIISTVIGLVAGGIISLFVSRHYYRRASRELEREAEVIKHYVNAVISYLEEAGLIQPRRDDEGNYLVPVGSELTVRLRVESATQRDAAEGTPREARDALETPSEASDKGDVPPEPQAGSERRSWWQRLLGR